MNRRIKYAIVCVLLVVGSVVLGYYSQASTRSLVETKTLYIGTINSVQTDNYVKDYYMNIFAEDLLLDRFADYSSTGRLIPYLLNWTTSDSRVWDLRLIRDTVWHDGVPVTADDVAFTLTYLKAKNPNYATHFQFVKSVVVVSPSNVRVELTRPSTAFATSFAATFVMPKHVWSTVTDPMTYDGKSRNIGSGPFMYGGYDSAAGMMTFNAFKNYWRGAPLVDALVLKFYKNTDAMIMALKKGEIATTYAYATGIDPLYVPTLLEDKNIAVKIVPNLGVDSTLFFNTQKYPNNMSDFRKAISYALDYEDYRRSIAAGYADIPTTSWLPSGWDYSVPGTLLARNVSLAASMLNSLNFRDVNSDGWREYPNGTAYVMRIYVRSDMSEALRLAQLVKRDLADVAIKAMIVPIDVAQMTTLVQGARAHDVLISRTTFWGNSMYAGCGTLYFDARNMGWANVNDPKYLAKVDELLTTANPARMRQLFAELQGLYSSEMYGIPLYWGKIIQPYRTDLVSNFAYNPMDGILCKDTWLSLEMK